MNSMMGETLMNKLNYLLLSVLSLFLLPQNVHAYIDAGTGSYILQIVLAVVIGGLYTIKRYWKILMGYFRSLSKKEEDNHEKRQ